MTWKAVSMTITTLTTVEKPNVYLWLCILILVYIFHVIYWFLWIIVCSPMWMYFVEADLFCIYRFLGFLVCFIVERHELLSDTWPKKEMLYSRYGSSGSRQTEALHLQYRPKNLNITVYCLNSHYLSYTKYQSNLVNFVASPKYCTKFWHRNYSSSESLTAVLGHVQYNGKKLKKFVKGMAQGFTVLQVGSATTLYFI